MTENEKKVKAPAKAKKNASEIAETKAAPAVKAKTEKKPRAKVAKTTEVAEPVVTVTSNGPQPVPNKAKSTQVGSPAPTHQQIAQLAHRFWKERGGHHGSHEQDWLRAEHELRGKAS